MSMHLLPDEILLLITDLIEDEPDRFQLSCCCRRFYHLLLPQVYKSITLEFCDEDLLSSLVHALLRKPNLAQAVRHLKLKFWDDSRGDPDYDMPYDLALLSPIVELYSHSEDERTKWEDALKGGVGDAWVALLLPLLPNLQTLKTEVPPGPVFFDRMLERAVTGQKPFDTRPAFSSLIEASLKPNFHSGEFVRISQIMQFARMPAMRRFTGTSFAEDGPCSAVVTSSITEMELLDSAGGGGMCNILRACPNLESFKYQHRELEEYDPLWFYFNPAGILVALAGAKPNLQSLWLGYFLSAGAVGSPTEDRFIGSLAEFRALKHLQLRAQNLLNGGPLIEILPSSLESLCIDHAGFNLSRLVDTLQQFIPNARKRIPHLVQLAIRGKDVRFERKFPKGIFDSYPAGRAFGIPPEVYDKTDTLRPACDEAGITFHVRDATIDYILPHPDCYFEGGESESESEGESERGIGPVSMMYMMYGI
jgi:hypothetical protein